MALSGHKPNRVEREPGRPLHECARCDSRLVHPVNWEQTDHDHWTVSLHCPNCHWIGSGTFDQALVDAFDEELNEGAKALMGDLRQLARANMADSVDRFIGALRAGAILPEDF